MKTKTVIYTSYLCSEVKYKELYVNSAVKPGIQVQKFNRLLVEGLSLNGINVQCLSSLPMSRIISQKIFIIERNDSVENVKFYYLPILNIPIIKDLLILVLSFFKGLFFACKESSSFMVCDILSMPNSLGCAIAYRLLGKKVLGIVTDLPEDVISTKIFLKLYYLVIQMCTHYVFMTKEMNLKLNKTGKPFKIIEGISDIKRVIEKQEENKFSSAKICLYAGNCNKKNGVDKLIEAILLLKYKNIILHIFGSGDEVGYIEKVAKKEKQIQYHGIQPNDEVLVYQSNSDLLINPRPSEEEFTKYSFPSKNMEYMTSGTPLLTTKLVGMPEEYYEYVYLFDDESVEGMSKKIDEVLSLSEETRKKTGLKAREFILKEKNNVIQTRKMIDLMKD